jgi:hypothetical protein
MDRHHVETKEKYFSEWGFCMENKLVLLQLEQYICVADDAFASFDGLS